MIKKLLLFLCFLTLGITGFAQNYSINPSTFEEDEQITITFTGIDESGWGVSSSHALYLWAWSTNTTNQQADSPTNGTWENSNEANKLTYVSSGTYSFTMVPKDFYGRTNLKQIGFLVKTKNGQHQSADMLAPVGKFQMTLNTPQAGSVNVVDAGTNVQISATTSTKGTFKLTANGTQITATSTPTTSFTYSFQVNADAQMELTGTSEDGTSTKTVEFSYLTTPQDGDGAIPTYIQQGINYKPGDATTVGLALYAPFKDYVHVIGSFNNWEVSSEYQMKRDTSNPDLFWIEISGLTPQQIYTFQYRTNDGVKVADPFSPLVLSPDDDPYIPASVYPNLPAYPQGQQYDVSVIQTGMPGYPWKITNFEKPDKYNLVIYEAVVRDFAETQSWQEMIDRIPYLKGLNINAIELMPIMEFDGNNSWGYNPGFHYALDKAYGTPDKFKEFVDTAHENGIAVILDIALNHATGRSPIERLWSTSSSGGYGDVAANNPYFNQEARHAYSVFYDLNHSVAPTQYYVKRVLEQWINEYKVDGFRWDLTKGFTQNCTPNDEGCTNEYQQDRVDILKQYADYQWDADGDSYVIFEHLGDAQEESAWASYRQRREGKGILLWNKMTDPYNQNTMGYTTDSDISYADYHNHTGFSERANVVYAESHDEERLMYKNLQFGASSGSYNVKDLTTALKRIEALGAILFPIPGPKMLTEFGELGYDFSINTCEDGSIGDCRTSPKPNAFTLAYDQDARRTAIYDTWSKIIGLKLENEVFNAKTFSIESGNLMPRIYIWNDNLPQDALKNVVILANFMLTPQSIVADFPYTGTWHNLMDETQLNVLQTNMPIALQPGEFRIFGNAQAKLSTEETTLDPSAVQVRVAQNPVTSGVAQIELKNTKGGTLSVYNMTGNVVLQKTIQQDGRIKIPVRGLAAGLYLIRVQSEKGSATAKMIVR